MDFALVFKSLLEAFEKERIDFALIGGFALQAVGIARTTCDIDLLILSKDGQKVRETMLKLGYKLIHESEDVLNFIGKPKIELGRVDFLLAHRKYALSMLKRANIKEALGGKFKVKVLQIEDLIGLKVQSSSNDPNRMHQDMADIELLIRNNYPELKMNILREYFGLFGREEELDRIIKGIKDA